MASEQKEKLIRFYKGTEGEEIVIKLVDLAENVLRTQKFRISGFLDPFGQEIAETVAANYGNIRVDFAGGYQGAERARAIFIHEDFAGTPTGFGIDCIEAKWNGQKKHGSYIKLQWMHSPTVPNMRRREVAYHGFCIFLVK